MGTCHRIGTVSRRLCACTPCVSLRYDTPEDIGNKTRTPLVPKNTIACLDLTRVAQASGVQAHLIADCAKPLPFGDLRKPNAPLPPYSSSVSCYTPGFFHVGGPHGRQPLRYSFHRQSYTTINILIKSWKVQIKGWRTRVGHGIAGQLLLCGLWEPKRPLVKNPSWTLTHRRPYPVEQVARRIAYVITRLTKYSTGLNILSLTFAFGNQYCRRRNSDGSFLASSQLSM